MRKDEGGCQRDKRKESEKQRGVKDEPSGGKQANE